MTITPLCITCNQPASWNPTDGWTHNTNSSHPAIIIFQTGINTTPCRDCGTPLNQHGDTCT